MRPSTARTPAITSSPSTGTGRSRTVAQRVRTARPSVTLMGSRRTWPRVVGHAGVAGEVHEQGHGPLGDAVFGIIEQQRAQAQGEAREALGIFGEQLAHVQRGHFAVVLFERLPGLGLGDAGHGGVPLAHGGQQVAHPRAGWAKKREKVKRRAPGPGRGGGGVACGGRGWPAPPRAQYIARQKEHDLRERKSRTMPTTMAAGRARCP